MIEIATERLKLRCACSSDLEPLHRILSNPRATAYWSTPPHRDRGETEEWLAAMIDIPPGEGEDFIVEHQGRVIGKAGLFRFPEIGFIFDPDHWGRGFATEGLRPIIDRAFAVHRLEAIEADVDPRNAASIAVLKRLGFTETRQASRTWLIGDSWCDSLYLRLNANR